MIRFSSILILLILPLFSLHGQEIRIEHKFKEGKEKTIRVDKPVMVKTFEGNKFKGNVVRIDEDEIVIDKATIAFEDIMTISGFILPDQKNRTIGVGLTIGAGIVAPVGLYFFLGGLAWAQPNGIFIGATIIAFDLLLAYAGTSLMGIYPRRFSTLNWHISTAEPLPEKVEIPLPVPLPLPFPRG